MRGRLDGSISFGCLGHPLGGGRGQPGGSGGRGLRVGCLRCQQVGGHLEVDGPRGRCHRRPRRFGHERAQRRRGRCAEGALHHRLEHRGLVGRLVQRAPPDPGATHRGGHVGGDHQHRRARCPRLADRPQRVGRARAGGRERHAELSARPRVTVGRVGGGLLVANPHQADRRIAERPPQRQVVHARQAEGDLDAQRPRAPAPRGPPLSACLPPMDDRPSSPARPPSTG